MSETQKNTTKKTNEQSVVESKHKVSLVELIMILLLVGLIFVFTFGMKQLKMDKRAEALAQQKFEAILPVLQTAIDAAEEFKRTDDFGDYPFDFGQLNLTDTAQYKVISNDAGELYVETDDFLIAYDADNYGFITTTKDEFGKAGIKVIYMLNDKSYSVEDPAEDRKPTIRDEWLPQD
ncbi:MAG: hypothetical protein RBR69_02245 [Candidatus Cloacimonadaceae bacterium]|jgi:hypothetical protein|nr:hypothetical protein [Candidatus Cloacimonadota bacterium]MDY0126941.1 hypothetical protein [Candidatus Cloacimonadaceae bacterium]MCB5254985.1 hypothetical protein [Candidatus Cloacimonadota bacterium]MCK9177570.1 hypothetical protein [Candidatus Cloacimonadota bacterium]MCK9242148.1 hypothetical protein [Candidatus Cloacimonadota bacterium]